MLQDSIVANMENDSNYVLNVVLRENDLHNWATLAPTRLYYCGGDTQVPHENALIAEQSMQALGAPDVDAVQINATFDHGPCVFPSILSSISFFRSFIMTSIPDLPADVRSLDITPNPAADNITIGWDAVVQGTPYLIVNMLGNVLRDGHTTHKLIELVE